MVQALTWFALGIETMLLIIVLVFCCHVALVLDKLMGWLRYRKGFADLPSISDLKRMQFEDIEH